jgi:DNA-binding transcriptional ArsR family regulator
MREEFQVDGLDDVFDAGPAVSAASAVSTASTASATSEKLKKSAKSKKSAAKVKANAKPKAAKSKVKAKPSANGSPKSEAKVKAKTKTKAKSASLAKSASPASAAATSPSSINFKEVSELLKMAADATRLRLLSLIDQGNLTVNQLATIIGQSQPAISHHLAMLRHGGVVLPNRQGKASYYELTNRGKRLVTGVNGITFGEE